jgi:hypothetical protein
MYKPFIVLIATLGLALNAGCGAGQTGDICAARIQCEGGNDRDVDACISRRHGDEQAAAVYDCSEAYFKYLDCVSASSTCSDNKYKDNCDEQKKSLNSCEEAASDNR